MLNAKALFCFCCGARGVGKSFASKTHVKRFFCKTKRRFIWFRRYLTEIKGEKGAGTTFWDDIVRVGKTDGDVLEVKPRKYSVEIYINNELAGYVMPLSMFRKFKSTDFSDVDIVFFDEFLVDKGQRPGYCGGASEPKMLLDAWQTIYRDRKPDGKIICLANAIDFYNPYFTYFKVPLFSRGAKVFGEKYVEIIENKPYEEHMQSTRFGELVKGTTYEDYAIKNIFADTDDTFLEKRKGTAIYRCTLKYMGQSIGVWYDYKCGRIYLGAHNPGGIYTTYALTTDDHALNIMLLNRRSPALRQLTLAYEQGYLRFETPRYRAAFTEFAGYIK